MRLPFNVLLGSFNVFLAPSHCAPMLETLSFFDNFPVLETLNFFDIFPVPGDFEFLQIFPVLGNIFLYRKTLMLYDFPRVLRNIFLHRKTLNFCFFPFVLETLSVCDIFPVTADFEF